MLLDESSSLPRPRNLIQHFNETRELWDDIIDNSSYPHLCFPQNYLIRRWFMNNTIKLNQKIGKIWTKQKQTKQVAHFNWCPLKTFNQSPVNLLNFRLVEVEQLGGQRPWRRCCRWRWWWFECRRRRWWRWLTRPARRHDAAGGRNGGNETFSEGLGDA